MLPVNVFLVGIGMLCGFRKEGEKSKRKTVGEAESERGLTRSNDGENGDQRREGGRMK